MFCSVFVEDKLKNWTLICIYHVHLCLQIRGDSNAVLLLMTQVSVQRVREGGELQRMAFTLPGASSSYPSQKFRMIYSAAVLLLRYVCCHNQKLKWFVSLSNSNSRVVWCNILFLNNFSTSFFSKVLLSEWNFCTTERLVPMKETHFFFQKVLSWVGG